MHSANQRPNENNAECGLMLLDYYKELIVLDYYKKQPYKVRVYPICNSVLMFRHLK